MKKIIGIIFVFLYLITITSIYSVEADPFLANEDIVAPPGTGFTSAVVYDDQMYVCADGIYRYKPSSSLQLIQSFGDTQWRLEKGSNFILISDGSVMYAFEWMLGRLYPIKIDDDAVTFDPPMIFNLEPLINYSFSSEEYVKQPRQLLIHEGRLFILIESGVGVNDTIMVSYDLKTGEGPLHYQTPSIIQMTAYKDGNLLLLAANGLNDFSLQAPNEYAALAIFDPFTNEVVSLIKTDLPAQMYSAGLLWSSMEDIVYLSDGQRLYQYTSWNSYSLVAAFLPSFRDDDTAVGLIRLAQGVLVYVHREGVSIRRTQSDYRAEKPLRIVGNTMNEMHRSAMLSLPDTPVSLDSENQFPSTEEFLLALLTGTKDFDIIFFESDKLDARRIMEKGYAQDLSASPSIYRFVQELFAQFRPACMLDNKIMLVPVNVSAETLGIRPAILREIGLKAPESINEFVDLYQDVRRFNDRHEFALWHSINDRKELVQLAITLFADQMASRDEVFSFTDPGLIQSLQKIEHLSIDQSIDAASSYEAYSLPELISLGFDLNLRYLHQSIEPVYPYDATIVDKEVDISQMTPLLLSTEIGQAPVLPITLTFAAINPNSDRADAAIKYIESYLLHLDKETLAMLQPSSSKPIEDPLYEEEIKARDDALAQRLSYLETTTGAERLNLELLYEYYSQEYDKDRIRLRYLVGESALSLYQSMLAQSYVRSFGDFRVFLEQPQMNDLIDRYIRNVIGLDQFIEEAQGRLRLMQNE